MNILSDRTRALQGEKKKENIFTRGRTNGWVTHDNYDYFVCQLDKILLNLYTR